MLRFGSSLGRLAQEHLEKSLLAKSRIAAWDRGVKTLRLDSHQDGISAGLGRREFSTETCEPRKTCLHDLHVEQNGKIVNFSGWLLPVQYRDAIAVSHQHTRTYASLFDVGHMMQTIVAGKNAGEYLESLTTIDLKNLAPGAASLTVFTNENGGILDDLIVTKDDEDKYFVVSNAGRRNEDSLLMNQRKDDFERHGKSVDLRYLDPLEQGLIALQGPTAAQALQRLVDFDLQKLKFMNSHRANISNFETRISRCGYTGEDGFEISVGGKDARSLVEMILENSDVKMAGLGARDSLRLEAGLCLYGHDIDEGTTPVEAGLTWLVAKRRRVEKNFPGAKVILEQIKTGARKKRIGLMLGQGPPARESAAILTPEGERVGHITSGGPSPTLGRPIAMGYVPMDLAQNGGGMLVEVRGKTYKATVTKMPFVKTNYYTGK
ncbi:aminomethyltransferase, mitochondrial isoform X2 [Venturia canescens]|uniref:aminomethyltransferase, mitochondrial isoform X2 n=1 Tax=Venturia canescens TaxID=32260 RepID=UPI001C9CE7BE|nr:aminomethyltransferase, mitochondrial isoform X2 [Venturia canescens]